MYEYNTTDSSRYPNTGAVQIQGGASINNNLYVGGQEWVVEDLDVSGNEGISGILKVYNTTDNTQFIDTGALQVLGGASIDKTLFVGKNVVVSRIGFNAGQINQGTNAIAIGNQSGYNNQGTNAVAIGYQAGLNNQGTSAVAIGYYAGWTNQTANSIAINATGTKLNTPDTSGCFIAPIRNATYASGFGNIATLVYDTVRNEVGYLTGGIVPTGATATTGYTGYTGPTGYTGYT